MTSAARGSGSAAIAALLVGLLLAAAPGSRFGDAAASEGPTGERPLRRGGVVVVASNLKEAFEAGDVARRGDMKVYVDRLLARLPQDPDVLLLQEVSLTSIEVVARLLRRKTGTRYRIAVAPLRQPWTETDTRIVDQETGILVNAKTTRAVSKGGFVKTSYPRRVAARGIKPRVRKNAYVTVRHLKSGSKMSVASVHLVQRTFLKSDAIAHRYKAAWAEQLAAALQREARAEGASVRTIGGDFNSTRALRTASGTVTSYTPFFVALSKRDFTDAVWTVTKMGGPDYVFTSGTILNAGYDSTYDPSRVAESSPRFYSDHRFRWAQVGV